MGTVLSYIFTALLILPLHTLSYVKTVLHVAQDNTQSDDREHHDDSGHSHGNDDHQHDAEHATSESAPGIDLSHQHASNQPMHSHDMDIWGLFANPGVCSDSMPASLPDCVSFLDPPVIDVQSPITDLFPGSLLRPPIA